MSIQFQIQYCKEWHFSLRRKHINQAFILFNYCTLYINFFNDCLLTLTVQAFLWTTIFKLTSFQLLYKPSVYSLYDCLLILTVINWLFQNPVFNDCLNLSIDCNVLNDRSFHWLSTYIDCNVLNDIVFVITAMFRHTDYFIWVSSFKSNTVKNDTSLYEESI